MPLHIFANRNRSGTYTMMLTIGAAIFAMFFFLTQFIRNILGYSPLKAGVAFLPVTVTIGALAAISARLVGRVGPKLPMTVGPSLAAVGLFWLSFIQADTDYWKVLLPTLFIAMGRGTSFVPLTLTAVSGVRRDEAGLTSALLNTGQQIGGSLGLAILVTVSTSATSTKLAHLLGSGSATAASGTPGAAGGVPRAVLNQAVTAGYGAAFRVAAVIALLAVIISLVVIRVRRQDLPAEGAPVLAWGAPRCDRGSHEPRLRPHRAAGSTQRVTRDRGSPRSPSPMPRPALRGPTAARRRRRG